MKKVLSGIAAFVMALSGLLAVASPAAADYCSDRTPGGRLGVYSRTYCYGVQNTYGTVNGDGTYVLLIKATSAMNDSNRPWQVCRSANFNSCRELQPGQRLSSVYAIGWDAIRSVIRS
jgi:hypothetical protein